MEDSLSFQAGLVSPAVLLGVGGEPRGGAVWVQSQSSKPVFRPHPEARVCAGVSRVHTHRAARLTPPRELSE